MKTRTRIIALTFFALMFTGISSAQKANTRILVSSDWLAKNLSKVIVLRTGGQASHAYFTLKYLGYDVVMYDGSFIEWSNMADTPIAK